MQIAGNRCKVCQHDIVLSNEGKFCGHCGTVVHLACEPRATCGVCGQSYHCYERPKADPLSEAVVPRALRPAKGGGLAFAIFAVVILTIVLIVIRYAFTPGR